MNVLLLIGIASIWSVVCLVAVALCVTAGRADKAMLEDTAGEDVIAVWPEDVGFVLMIAEATPETAHKVRPAVRRPVH